MQTIDTIMGPISAPDWPEDLIVRALLDLGEWARIEQVLAATLVREGDVLWDGGAFLGTFGIGVAQLAAAAGRKPSRLLAIDPGTELRPCTEANLATLAPCPAELVSCAVALDRMTMTMDHTASERANHGGIAYVPTEADASDSVVGRPLWDLRNEFGDYDFLKLDLEGGEFDALRSDFEFLRLRKPVIWAECNESHSSVLALEALVSLGYDPLYVAFPTFRKVSYRPQGEAPYVMAYEAVLLATSPDRPLVVSATGIADQVILRPVKTSWDLRQALWATPRWAMKEWTKMPRHELIGILGKVSQGMNLQDYLADSPQD